MEPVRFVTPEELRALMNSPYHFTVMEARDLLLTSSLTFLWADADPAVPRGLPPDDDVRPDFVRGPQ